MRSATASAVRPCMLPLVWRCHHRCFAGPQCNSGPMCPWRSFGPTRLGQQPSTLKEPGGHAMNDRTAMRNPGWASFTLPLACERPCHATQSVYPRTGPLYESVHQCLRSRYRWVAVRAVAERKRDSPFGAVPKNIEPQFFRSPLAEQRICVHILGRECEGRFTQDSGPQLPLVNHVRGRGPR